MLQSVTSFVKECEQPSGGYLNPHLLEEIIFDDGVIMNPHENLQPSIIGLVVDYLVRYSICLNVKKTFDISYAGAKTIGQEQKAEQLMNEIKGLDSESVVAACQLCAYDVCCRDDSKYFKPVELYIPDDDTIFNIQTMVQRGISFLKKYGPVKKTGFTFGDGYSLVVASGDGDYLTETGLWDFKVSAYSPTKLHTMQILVYYLMGLKSDEDIYYNLKELGLFNPRKNIGYRIEIENLDQNVLHNIFEKIYSLDTKETWESFRDWNFGLREYKRKEKEAKTLAKKIIRGSMRTKLSEDDYLRALEVDFDVFPHIPDDILTEELCKTAIGWDGAGYEPKDLPERFQTENIYVESIRKQRLKLKDLPIERRSKKVCIEALSVNLKNLKYIPPDMLTKEFYVETIEKAPGIFTYMPNEYKTEDVIISYIRKCPYGFRNIPKEKISQTICNIAVQMGESVLNEIPEQYITEDMCINALKNSKRAMKYVPDSMKTEKVIAAAPRTKYAKVGVTARSK